ncbi:MAG: rhodanese-like domain-containing protein [Anaerolineales bacterium]|nr:rhodanese-like domain-containing protein [Anaerolineales bacterium]
MTVANLPRLRVWLWPTLGVLVVIAVGFLIIQPELSTLSYPQEVSVAEAAAKQKAGAFILDVRSEAEWKAAHIPGSALISLPHLADWSREVPRRREVILVCTDDEQCAQAFAILRAAGVPALSRMMGGIEAWQAAGYPVESEP